MWKMLQKKIPEDYVIATGKQYTVKQFATLVLKELGIKHKWLGKGIKQRCVNTNNKEIIKVDKKYFRPLEVDTLLGNAKKARVRLNWKPKYNINKLVKEMVKQELKNLNG